MSTANRAGVMGVFGMSAKHYPRQAGMSLVEVFVALLVLSVGLIALAKLQVDLVRGGGDSRARTAALALAEEKIEDLRTFTLKTAPPNTTWTAQYAADPTHPMAWDFIANNAGGRIPSNTAIERAGVLYSLSWTATTQSTVGPTVNGVPGYSSRYKVIQANVSWTSADGQLQTVSTLASVPDTPPGLVEQASKPLTSQAGPNVSYTPGTLPEVVTVPIHLDAGGDTHRETSKPLPSVLKKGDSTLVTFDVVNYRKTSANEPATLLRREEFATISCRCTLTTTTTTTTGRSPAKVVLVGNQLRDKPGAMVAKPEGGVYVDAQTDPTSLCNICCRDHHDASDVGPSDAYNPANPGHKHYVGIENKTTKVWELKLVNNLPVVANENDIYLEACRLKRINGVFQVFQDWQLRTLTVLPQSDLSTADNKPGPKFSAYTTAVQKFVADFAKAKANGSTSVPTSLDFTPSVVYAKGSQLLARAIYIDYMTTDLLKKIKESPDDSSVLSLVPFYELHLTKLADWMTRDQPQVSVKDTNPVANVTSDPIPDGKNVYSRGVASTAANAIPNTKTKIIASAKNYNTGITGTSAINDSEDGIHPSVPYSVKVPKGPDVTFYKSSADPEPEQASAEHKDGVVDVFTGDGIYITGSFIPVSGSPGCVLAQNINTPSITDSAVCEEKSASGNEVEAFSCTVPPGWKGTISFSATTGSDYSFCPYDNTCSNPTATWGPDAGIDVSTPLPVWVRNNNVGTCP